jgi:hypothetical protein
MIFTCLTFGRFELRRFDEFRYPLGHLEDDCHRFAATYDNLVGPGKELASTCGIPEGNILRLLGLLLWHFASPGSLIITLFVYCSHLCSGSKLVQKRDGCFVVICCDARLWRSRQVFNQLEDIASRLGYLV